MLKVTVKLNSIVYYRALVALCLRGGAAAGHSPKLPRDARGNYQRQPSLTLLRGHRRMKWIVIRTTATWSALHQRFVSGLSAVYQRLSAATSFPDPRGPHLYSAQMGLTVLTPVPCS